MSRNGEPDRRRKRATSRPPVAPPRPRNVDDDSTPPAPAKLARGTRDIPEDEVPEVVADAGRIPPFEHVDVPEDIDTIVVDPSDLDDVAHADAEELPDAPTAEEASIDHRMLELGKRRFGISAFRPGQALAIRNV